jgi:hypothetical protein
MNLGAMSIAGLVIGAAGGLVALLVRRRWARSLGLGLLAVAVVLEIVGVQMPDRSSASGGGPRRTTVPPPVLTVPSEEPSSTQPSSAPLPSLNIRPALLSHVHPGTKPIVKRVTVNKEFVRLFNHATHPIYLGGWHLTNGTVTFTFPGVTLPAGKSLDVRTGPGTDSFDVLHWNLTYYVWHHPSGTIVLRNAKGVLVDTCTYHMLSGETSAGC